jgi:hypothetical protein
MKTQLVGRVRGLKIALAERPQHPRKPNPHQHGHKTSWQTKGQPGPRRIREQDQQHGEQSDCRRRKYLEDESHGDERDRNARQRRQQRRSWRVTPHPIRKERAHDLHHAVEQTGQQARLPRQSRIPGRLVDRTHDQENESEQTHRVDPVGKGGDVVTAGGPHQSPRLPRIIQVPNQNRDRRPRQDATVDQILGQAAHHRTKRGDQHQLKKIIDEQPEKSVHIAPHEPSRTQWGS